MGRFVPGGSQVIQCPAASASFRTRVAAAGGAAKEDNPPTDFRPLLVQQAVGLGGSQGSDGERFRRTDADRRSSPDDAVHIHAGYFFSDSMYVTTALKSSSDKLTFGILAFGILDFGSLR